MIRPLQRRIEEFDELLAGERGFAPGESSLVKALPIIAAGAAQSVEHAPALDVAERSRQQRAVPLENPLQDGEELRNLGGHGKGLGIGRRGAHSVAVSGAPSSSFARP